MKKLFLLTFALFGLMLSAYAQVFDIVVAKDGTGDYSTIQAAVDAANGTTRTTIYIKKGIYKEKVLVNKANISLIGQSAKSVIITWDDYSGKGALGTSTCETMKINSSATGFYGENFTVENSYGQGSQAVALNVRPDQAAFKNVRMLSFQDTFYSWVNTQTNRQYYYQCYIEGATDFLCGGGIVYFDECDIYCVSAANGGYVSAAQPSDLREFGYVFQNCTIDGDDLANVGKPFFLGRPWANGTDGNGKMTYLNTKIKASILSPAGWNPWGGGETSNYAFEYNSMDLSGTPLDVSGRVAWSQQLTASEAADYSMTNVLGSWNPTALVKTPDAPANLDAVGQSLTWDAVADMKGYVIIRNNKAIGFSETNAYNDETAVDGVGYTYTVQAISANGNLSDNSNEALINGGLNDNEAPSVPTDVKAKETADFGIEISWTASTDNEGVAGYKIYKDGGELTSVFETTFSETIPSKERDKVIAYRVMAFDDADNESAMSASVSVKVKTALIDENFANWNEYTTPATPTSVDIFGAGEKRTVELTSCQVMPTRPTSGGSPAGTVGAIRMESGGVITLPSMPSIESFSYTAGTASTYTVEIILEKFDGSSWIEIDTKEIGQLCNEYKYPELRQKTPIQLRLRNLNTSVVYVHDLYLDAYVPGNDPYPTGYADGDILIDEHFNSQVWLDNATSSALAASVFAPITILDVARTIEITAKNQILPERGKPGAAPDASAGAIALAKPASEFGASAAWVVLPELPSCKEVSVIWTLGNATPRGVRLEKFNGTTWEQFGELALPTAAEANDYRQGKYTWTVNSAEPIQLRLSNGQGTGDIYLNDLKVTAYKPGGSGIADNKIKTGFLQNTLVNDVLQLKNPEDFAAIEIYALSGQKQLVVKVNGENINVSALNKGIYIAKGFAKNGDLYADKIVKK